MELFDENYVSFVSWGVMSMLSGPASGIVALKLSPRVRNSTAFPSIHV